MFYRFPVVQLAIIVKPIYQQTFQMELETRGAYENQNFMVEVHMEEATL